MKNIYNYLLLKEIVEKVNLNQFKFKQFLVATIRLKKLI
jgi:hypothetical protein